MNTHSAWPHFGAFTTSSVWAFVILSTIVLISSLCLFYIGKWKEERSLIKRTFYTVLALLLLAVSLSIPKPWTTNFTQENWTDHHSFSNGLSSSGAFPKLSLYRHMGIEVICSNKDFKDAFSQKLAEAMAKIAHVQKVSVLGKYNEFTEDDRLDGIIRIYVEELEGQNLLLSRSFKIRYKFKIQDLACEVPYYERQDSSSRIDFSGEWTSSLKLNSWLSSEDFLNKTSRYCSIKLAELYRQKLDEVLAESYIGQKLPVKGKVGFASVRKKMNLPFVVTSDLTLKHSSRTHGKSTGQRITTTYLLKNKSLLELKDTVEEQLIKNKFVYTLEGQPSKFGEEHSFYVNSWTMGCDKKLENALVISVSNPPSSFALSTDKKEKERQRDWLVNIQHFSDFDDEFVFQKKFREMEKALASDDTEALDSALIAYYSWEFDKLEGHKNYCELGESVLARVLKKFPRSLRYHSYAATKFKRLKPAESLLHYQILYDLVRDKVYLYGHQFELQKSIDELKQKLAEQAKQEISDV